jgi:hypothetical protein
MNSPQVDTEQMERDLAIYSEEAPQVKDWNDSTSVMRANKPSDSKRSALAPWNVDAAE